MKNRFKKRNKIKNCKKKKKRLSLQTNFSDVTQPGGIQEILSRRISDEMHVIGSSESEQDFLEVSQDVPVSNGESGTSCTLMSAATGNESTILSDASTAHMQPRCGKQLHRSPYPSGSESNLPSQAWLSQHIQSPGFAAPR